MGGDFAPGGDKFFVFWIISIPVALITIAIIYADSIRKLTIEQYASLIGKEIRSDTSSSRSEEGAEVLISSIGRRIRRVRVQSLVSGLGSDLAASSHHIAQELPVPPPSPPPPPSPLTHVMEWTEGTRLRRTRRRKARDRESELGWLRAFGTIVGYNPGSIKKTPESSEDSLDDD